MRSGGDRYDCLRQRLHLNGSPFEDASTKEPPLKVDGDVARYNHRVGNDDYG